MPIFEQSGHVTMSLIPSAGFVRRRPQSGRTLSSFLLVSLLSAGFAATIVLAPETAVAAPWDKTQDLPATELLEQLRQVEVEAQRLSPRVPLECRTQQLAFVLGGIHQGVTNVYADDRSRYLAVQLFAVNTTDAPQTLDVASIQLWSGGRKLTWQARPSGIDGYTFQAGQRHIAIREVQPPDALSIPANSVASTWLLFAGLEMGAFVPDLQLEIPSTNGAFRLDVNLYQRAVLRQKVERMGPFDCLALISLNGPMNTVNVGAFADTLESLSGEGVHRVVVAFAPEEPPINFLLDWMTQSRVRNPYEHQFRLMPAIPTGVQELHLVLPKLKEPRDLGAFSHKTTTAAIIAALKTAFDAAPTEDVIIALRGSQVGVRAAALEFGASRLRPEQLPIVLRSIESSEPEVRLAAVAALGNFSAPEAVATLVKLARGEDKELAAVVVRGLASSRFPQHHAALAELISDSLPIPPQELVDILAGYPRPEWREAVLHLTSSSDPRVQQAAMQALSRLGHARLMEVLTTGLKSKEARVREEAFQRLCDLGTREADELAFEYALTRLKTDPPTAAINQFLIRVRDQRAVPLLVKHLDGPEGVRRNIIELLAQIGDQSVGAEIARRYPKLTNPEKVIALQALQNLESPHSVTLAMAAIRVDDASLVQRAVGNLQADGSDAAVAAMAAAIATKTDHTSIHFLCNGLGMIGTPSARAALIELRRSKEEPVQRSAQQGLQVMWNQSPARELVGIAESDLTVAMQLDRGISTSADESLSPEDQQRIKQERIESVRSTLEVAARIDPYFPELAYLQGLFHALVGETDAAIASFRRAIELNDEMTDAYSELGQTLYGADRLEEAIPPLEHAWKHDTSNRRHQWLTTRVLAMIRLGQVDAGLKLLKDQADKFRGEPVFEYNQACIYGRAVEQLRLNKEVAPDDPRFAVYSEEAVRMLELAFQHNIESATRDPDMRAYLRDDADLLPLHSIPVFRKFAELDLPEAERTKSPPVAPIVPLAPGISAPLL